MASVGQWCLMIYAITLASSNVLLSPDGLYRKAAHYFKLRSNQLIDGFSSSSLEVFPLKLKTEKTKQLGDVISLKNQNFYVNIKGLRRECATDPNVCPSGLSVAFWLYLVNGRYIITGGSYRDEPRASGFIVLHDSNSSQLRIEVATVRQKWTALLHKIPFIKQWFHLVFTWSVTTGLRISVNGQFLLQDAGAEERNHHPKSPHEPNGILIGDKDPSNGSAEDIDFRIGHLAIWDKALDSWDIQLAYQESIEKNTLSSTCCSELSANKCVSNVCYKFREPEFCKQFFNRQKCLCPETRVREKCNTHVFKGECKDRRKDCKALAAQNGYCDYYQQEMEMLCPLSCKFCNGLYSKVAHYFKLRSNQLIDEFSSSSLEVFPLKLKTKRTKQLGDVISLKNQNFYVNIKGLRRECATDPNVCSSGLSVAFWLYLVNGRYIITGGSYRDEPRASGFIVLHDSNSSQLRIEVATLRHKWTALLHKIPFIKQWFHLVFTWSVTTGLRISVNGQFLLQDAGAEERNYHPKSPHEPNGILIGDKDPSNGSTEDIDFKIGHLVIWNKALDSWDIQLAYKESIEKNTFSSTCCSELSANKCVSNVCYKFRAPEFCKQFFNRQKCLCPETRVREKCNTHVFKGECKDRRKDCKALAAQNGYCDYYQQEMEMLCPLSCKSCVLPRNKADGRKGAKMSKEVLVFALIGCAAGIILLFLISLYSWKVYRRKKWMKWSTYFVTVIPRDQSDGRLHGKDELEQ